jgi:FkbM family methyltransferase
LEDPRDRRAQEWIAQGNDRTLRLEYDLGPESLVFDLGGYEGQWASDIYGMYRCRVEVFEPVPRFAKQIAARFEQNPDISIHSIGLAAHTGQQTIGMQADRSSLYDEARDANAEEVVIELVRAADFFRDHEIAHVDLMKVNIEGGEYDLLDHLLDVGLAAQITDLQVQFHDFVPDASARVRSIRSRLAETHEPTYQVEFVWENWRRR